MGKKAKKIEPQILPNLELDRLNRELGFENTTKIGRPSNNANTVHVGKKDTATSQVIFTDRDQQQHTLTVPNWCNIFQGWRNGASAAVLKMSEFAILNAGTPIEVRIKNPFTDQWIEFSSVQHHDVFDHDFELARQQGNVRSFSPLDWEDLKYGKVLSQRGNASRNPLKQGDELYQNIVGPIYDYGVILNKGESEEQFRGRQEIGRLKKTEGLRKAGPMIRSIRDRITNLKSSHPALKSVKTHRRQHAQTHSKATGTSKFTSLDADMELYEIDFKTFKLKCEQKKVTMTNVTIEPTSSDFNIADLPLNVLQQNPSSNGLSYSTNDGPSMACPLPPLMNNMGSAMVRQIPPPRPTIDPFELQDAMRMCDELFPMQNFGETENALEGPSLEDITSCV